MAPIVAQIIYLANHSLAEARRTRRFNALTERTLQRSSAHVSSHTEHQE